MAKQEALVLCLEVVEKKAKEGKKLAKGDLTKHQAAIDSALEQQLIEKVSADKYRLMEKGQMFLLSHLPVERQVAHFRDGFHKLRKQWETACEILSNDLAKVSQRIGNLAGEAMESMNGKFEEASRLYESAIQDFGDGSSWKNAAEQFRSLILADVEESYQQIAETSKRTSQEIAAHTNQIDQLETTIKSFEERVAETQDDKQPEPSEATPAPEPTAQTPEPESSNGTPIWENDFVPVPPTEEQLWEMTKQTHEEFLRQNSHLGNFVNIPVLTDRVTSAVDDLPPKQFHEYLRKWQAEDKVILQVCSNPENEPRSHEGIQTDNGLLFYVEMPS